MNPRPLNLLADVPSVPLNRLLEVRESGVAEVFPGHPVHQRVRYLWTDQPEGVEGLENAWPDVSPVELFAVREVELRSDWTPYKDGAVIASSRIHPTYLAQFYGEGLIDNFGYPGTSRVRRIRGPAFIVSHFNMRTYGHFLFEVLPKLLLVRKLHAAGWRAPLLFPRSQPNYAAIARLVCPDVRLLLFDDLRESVSVRLALMPSMMTSPAGVLHDSIAGELRSMRDGFLLTREPPKDRRLFLSRQGLNSFRVLKNEAALADVAAGFGFVLIRPETLAWDEQVRLFAGATHVVGEVSSALHNTVFCPSTARVVGLNWRSTIQSGLAATAGHAIGYLPAAGDVRTEFEVNWTEAKTYEVDPEVLRARLASIC